MKMGCKFTGECEFRKAQKTMRQGRRDSFHIYCTMDGLCTQQTINALKCDAPTVDIKNP